jgi:very-short-patch-repair endonuclease
VPQATTTLYRAGLLTGWVVTETCSRHRVPVPKLETRIARDLRRGMNRTEWRVWIRLRGRQVEGAKFRRQHPIGPYFADFYCPASRLVVEVDGPLHGDDVPTAYDQRRTAWLEADGYHVIRFLASEVDDDLDAVVDGIRAAILKWASPSGASRHLLFSGGEGASCAGTGPAARQSPGGRPPPAPGQPRGRVGPVTSGSRQLPRLRKPKQV